MKFPIYLRIALVFLTLVALGSLSSCSTPDPEIIRVTDTIETITEVPGESVVTTVYQDGASITTEYNSNVIGANQEVVLLTITVEGGDLYELHDIAVDINSGLPELGTIFNSIELREQNNLVQFDQNGATAELDDDDDNLYGNTNGQYFLNGETHIFEVVATTNNFVGNYQILIDDVELELEKNVEDTSFEINYYQSEDVVIFFEN